jgi:hypothetical protein
MVASVNSPSFPEAAWAIDERDFPRGWTTADQIRFLLGYAILAPSGLNSQPWLFRVHDNWVQLFADRARGLPVVDPSDRELTISCGAALFNLRVALGFFGIGHEVTLLPEDGDPEELARVVLHGEPTTTHEELLRLRRALGQLEEGLHPGDESAALERIHAHVSGADAINDPRLFHAMLYRHTNRFALAPRTLPSRPLVLLADAAASEGARLVILDAAQRGAAADLIAEGDRIQWANRSFRREMAAWTHSNGSRRADGIPGYGLGYGDVLSYAGPIVMRTFDLGEGRAARDREIATGSPVLAVLCTDEDTTHDWLVAGQALERVLLRATAEGIAASYLNQPIEVPELRPRLSQALGHAGVPQLVLRLGYGRPVRPTPRRPLASVLID